MKPICRDLQERLAGEGATALRADAAAQRHLEECAECFRVMEELARLDEALAAMPATDAPDVLVDDLRARVKDDGARAASPSLETSARRSPPRYVLWALATAASVAIAFSVMTPSLMRARVSTGRDRPTADFGEADRIQALPAATPAPGEKQAAANKRPLSKEEEEKLRALGYLQNALPTPSPLYREPTSRDDAAARRNEHDKFETMIDGKDTAQERRKADLDDRGVEGGMVGGVPGGVAGGIIGGTGDEFSLMKPVRVGGALTAPKLVRSVEPVYPEAARRARVEGRVGVEIEIAASGKVTRARIVRSIPLLDAAALAAVTQWVYTPTLYKGQPIPVIMTVSVEFRLPRPPQEKPGSSEMLSPEPARAFLAERATTEGVAFQPATGYWANTYLPGDPALRLLRARLLAWDRSPLQAQAGFPLRLHDDAIPPSQPFDPPHSAGLAVYLHADRAALDKPSRMLVQVGLQGAPRSGASRPPVSLGLVLDLRGDVPADTAAGMRALAMAFSEAREVGDRFSLIVAGRSTGVAVGPDKFRHGPLAVALDTLLTSDAPAGAEAQTLSDAVAAALLEASHRDDPDAALGSSAVVVATGQSLGDSAEALADLAHQGAVAGIPLSVVALGPGAPLAEMDRLALAGQGSRRVLASRAEAPRLADEELSADSNVVARAVRLRIRLAAGVRLVGVVGSRRLDEAQAQRVREAERSIDLRLSRNLGIESDRGEDEDGIQLVIPAFRAGDAHVILLDVVAPGPGAVADVSVRYKDLAFLRNGVARASLSLPAGGPGAGPLERNVLKNLLAWRLSETLGRASAALEEGDPAGAKALVDEARALRGGLLACGPGLTGDAEIVRDVAMLDEYSRVLAAGAAIRPHLAGIADSLRYAGRLKLRSL